MEKQRVLAYHLAVPLSLEELDQIAGGGGGGMQMTQRQTMQATGNSATGPDMRYDVAVDF